MPYTSIYIHAVWGTKNRTPYLTPDVKIKIIQHIKDNASSKNIFIDSIDGSLDHLHCLFRLNPDLSLSKVMQLIKGESSYWINKEKLTLKKFEWADEYFAVSVSDSVVGKVREYISNQEEHHRKLSFKEEFEILLSKHGLLKYG